LGRRNEEVTNNLRCFISDALLFTDPIVKE
jgi:hypothetical protein